MVDDRGESVSVPDLSIVTHEDGTRDLVSKELGFALENFKLESFSFGLAGGRHVVANSWQGFALTDEQMIEAQVKKASMVEHTRLVKTRTLSQEPTHFFGSFAEDEGELT